MCSFSVWASCCTTEVCTPWMSCLWSPDMSLATLAAQTSSSQLKRTARRRRMHHPALLPLLPVKDCALVRLRSAWLTSRATILTTVFTFCHLPRKSKQMRACMGDGWGLPSWSCVRVWLRVCIYTVYCVYSPAWRVSEGGGGREQNNQAKDGRLRWRSPLAYYDVCSYENIIGGWTNNVCRKKFVFMLQFCFSWGCGGEVGVQVSSQHHTQNER